MWLIVINAAKYLFKNPIYIAVILLTISCGTLYVNNIIQDGKIAKLEASVTAFENNFNTCKSNETVLKQAIGECNGAADSWATSNEALRVQSEEYLIQIADWQKLYDEKLCLTNDDETPVVPSQGKVVGDEKSADAVNRLNSIFTD